MMKRLILTLMALALFAAVPALAADSQEDWEVGCNWVIAQDTALYTATLRADATAAEPYDFTESGTLPAGTMVRIRSSAQGMREIYYWNSGECTGWVDAAAVAWAVEAPDAASQAIQPTDAWSALSVTLQQDDGEALPVSLQVLGTAQCIVYDGAHMRTVSTSDLLWETEAPQDQRLGIINAPKTGKASLRATPSTAAKAIGHCEDGRVVVVLKAGVTWTRILYDGQEGCVLTAALTLCGAVPEEDFSQAVLSYKGRTDTAAAISVYGSVSASHKIGQWRAGTPVVALGTSGSWTEIEVGGWHGFVKSDCLK